MGIGSVEASVRGRLVESLTQHVPTDPLPLSLLNDYLYCPRRAALKIVEGWRSGNDHTARGDIVHEHADLPGYEIAKSVTLLRALPVWSDRLGLNGKCDIVEKHPDGSLFPVEFKVGKRRKWVNDDVQLCAQALCLEEMFRASIPRAGVFHADSKRRREVDLDEKLRALTEASVRAIHAMYNPDNLPPAHYVKGSCEECSLFQICLPRVTRSEAVSAIEAATRRLYHT